MTRPKLRSDSSGLFSFQNAPITFANAPAWVARRGSVIYESSVDIIGGFPGFADRACLLENARLRITDRYLLVEEGLTHGFGLPVDCLHGAMLVQQPGRDGHALRVFYDDNRSPRLFTIQFRSSRIGARGVERAIRAQQALHTAGVIDRFDHEDLPAPNFTLPWDQAREFDCENVIWTGRANAPIQVGMESVPSDVWLTTKSLIWGSGNGEGINRVPLTLLMDLVSSRLRDRAGSPAIYLSIGDDRTGRFEIPFVFDLQTPPDRNFRERGALLVGLRSRGLPDGSPAQSRHPWRLDPPELTNAGLDLAPVTFAGDSVDDIAWVGDDDTPIMLSSWIAPIRRTSGLGGRLHRLPVKDGSGEVLRREPVNSHELSDDTQASPIAENDRPMPGPSNPPATGTYCDISALTSTSTAAIERSLATIEDLEDSTERFNLARTDRATTAPGGSDPGDFLLSEFSSSHIGFAESNETQVETSWPATGSTTNNGDPAEISDRDDLIVVATPPMAVRLPIEDVIHPVREGEDSWQAVRCFEETAIGALADALRVTDARVEGNSDPKLNEHAPNSWEHARALAALAELQQRGLTTSEEARQRRERLLSLGDVSVRLRTLVELFDGDYLTAEDLDAKRRKLVRQLSSALIPYPL